MSCKAIFELLKLARQKHLEAKRKFSTFKVGDLHLYNDDKEPSVPRKLHPIFALQELLADKDAALDFCWTLRVGGVNPAGHLLGKYDNVGKEALSITQKLVPKLKA